jgi:uncharacterized glyoxalase superfamily protein PhnB
METRVRTPDVVPYLVVRDPAGLVQFIRWVVDGVEIDRVEPSFRGPRQDPWVRVGEGAVLVGRAEGDADVMNAMLCVRVDDVDAAYARAVAAGAETVRAPETTAWAVRSAGVLDPFGNQWYLVRYAEPAAVRR